MYEAVFGAECRPELKRRIMALRAEGMTRIAHQLNRERVRALREGAKWRPSSVRARPATGARRASRG
jgi:hypothetical protein